MTITQDFYTFLSAQAGMPDSIYPQFLPATHLGFPALTFSLSDDADIPLLNGFSDTRVASIDVDCWSKSLIEAEAVATTVKAALIGYVGVFGAHSVIDIRKARELSLYESDTFLHRISLQFSISYG